jgi:hypothetical protein
MASTFCLQKGNETTGGSVNRAVAMALPADAVQDQIISRNVGSSFITDQLHSLVIGTEFAAAKMAEATLNT